MAKLGKASIRLVADTRNMEQGLNHLSENVKNFFVRENEIIREAMRKAILSASQYKRETDANGEVIPNGKLILLEDKMTITPILKNKENIADYFEAILELLIDYHQAHRYKDKQPYWDAMIELIDCKQLAKLCKEWDKEWMSVKIEQSQT